MIGIEKHKLDDVVRKIASRVIRICIYVQVYSIQVGSILLGRRCGLLRVALFGL